MNSYLGIPAGLRPGLGYIVIVTALRGGSVHSSSLLFQVLPVLAEDNKPNVLIGVIVTVEAMVVLFFVLSIIASIYILL